MTRTLAISDTGLRLIKAFEGFRPDDRTLVTGVRVVGYGHRLNHDDASVQMSRANAEEQLLEDLEPIEDVVNDEVHAPLSQGQFDSLCSLAFNIGIDAFRASDIVRAMNNGRVLDAANGFDVWRKATVNGKTYVVDALMRRRTAEKSLFLRNEPAVPAPSAMLQPQADMMTPPVPTTDKVSDFDNRSESGVIEAVNIINAERVDPAVPAAAIVTASDLASLADDTDFDDLDLADAELLDDDLNEDDDLDTDDLDDEFEDDIDFDDESDDDFDDDDLIDIDLDDDDLLSDDFEEDALTEIEDVASEDDEALDKDAIITPDAASFQDNIEGETEETHEEPDLSALIAPAETFELVTDADVDETDLDAIIADVVDDGAEASSVISSAATSLGDRLSALLDTDETEVDAKPDSITALPTSLLQPVETTDTVSDESDLVVSEAQEIEAQDEVRSNLVSFPKKELVLDDAIAPDELVSDHDETQAADNEGLKVIDDLAADDVIRASRDPENAIFDPEGDPVENAMRYLERQASENEAKKSSGGLWIPIALGALLVGVSAVLIGRGATHVLSSWGPTAVTAAAITGGLTIIFGIYAAARGRFV